MTKEEVLKLALEALETLMIERGSIYDKAITAIREALAQPEQEPVAWRYKILDYFGRPVWTFKTPKTDIRVFESQPLYTSPPQHTWVGLTDEDDLDWGEGGSLKDLVKAIENKLKEKNI